MKNSLPIFLFFLTAVASAQEIATGMAPSIVQNNDVPLLYRNEQEFGGVIHSSGWGFNYRRGKHVTGYIKRIIEAEIVGMKHPKEIKLEVPEIGSKGYFYGKQFALTILRGGYGYNKIITGKRDRRGVELRLVTLGGPSLALAKPVYVEIWHDAPDPPFGKITTEKFDVDNPLHTTDYIVGRAGYFNGFGEMKFYPGGFLKLGLSFEHSSLDDDIKLLETGIVMDAYYKTIPVMAKARNNQIYLNVYLNLMFGKKWF